jgi:hypothetical protein
MTEDVSERAALLRSQAVNACYVALCGSEVRVYGTEPKAYSGAFMDGNDTIRLQQQFTEMDYDTNETVTWQYETEVTVTVRREAVQRKAW